MRLKDKGYTIDSLAIVSGDHLLTALAQIALLDQESIAWLHEWTEGMIQLHNREDNANERAVFVAFNTLVCSYIDQSEA
jgi:hypothetical protein